MDRTFCIYEKPKKCVVQAQDGKGGADASESDGDETDELVDYVYFGREINFRMLRALFGGALCDRERVWVDVAPEFQDAWKRRGDMDRVRTACSVWVHDMVETGSERNRDGHLAAIEQAIMATCAKVSGGDADIVKCFFEQTCRAEGEWSPTECGKIAALLCSLIADMGMDDYFKRDATSLVHNLLQCAVNRVFVRFANRPRSTASLFTPIASFPIAPLRPATVGST
jgi:hypothetical protein